MATTILGPQQQQQQQISSPQPSSASAESSTKPDSKKSSKDKTGSKKAKDTGPPEFYHHCRQISKIIRARKESIYFHEAVDTVILEDYLEVVQHPINMLTIYNKTNELKYKTFEEFRDDFELMFDNCIRYRDYGKNLRSDYSQLALDAEMLRQVFRGEYEARRLKMLGVQRHKSEKVTYDVSEYALGELLLVKISGSPWWPSEVIPPGAKPTKKTPLDQMLVRFLADDTCAWIKPRSSNVKRLTIDDLHKGPKVSTVKGKKLSLLQRAYTEALAIAEERAGDVSEAMVTEQVYEVEAILDCRQDNGQTLFLVQWKGQTPAECEQTWEPLSSIESCEEVLARFFSSRNMPPLDS
eukprot:c4417_g2_i1.p1 GENE.c4417_g2_i1~~c4417_g2_i1.p1  ORF type:complete len:353 (-),score=98.67 c4417_g2_i1:36-1094(-)